MQILYLSFIVLLEVEYNSQINYTDSSWNTCILEVGVTQRNAIAFTGAKFFLNICINSFTRDCLPTQ